MTKRMQFFQVVLILSLLIVVFDSGLIATRIQLWTRNGRSLASSTTPYFRNAGHKKDILILGDSLPYGVGASSPEASFAGQISDIFPDHNIINKAVIGDSTRELADTITDKVDKKYDMIFVFIGGNDIARFGIDIEDSKNNLKRITEFSAQHSRQVFTFTSADFANVSIVPWFMSGFYSDRSETIRQASIENADQYQNVDYIDVFDIEKDTYKTLEANDRFHLNDDGITALIKTLKEKLEQ